MAPLLQEEEEEQKKQLIIKYNVGIAFSASKMETFLTPSFLSLASTRGIHLVPIDPSRPISDQSPRFDLVLHKLYDPQWVSNLQSFSDRNPSVPIVDPIANIRTIQNRVSMLSFVSLLPAIPDHKDHTFGIPKQIEVDDTAALEDPATISGFRFPIIAKPFHADGTSVSHKMALVFNRDGLVKQPAPVVLQEFVNHGGVVFKVYVAGDYVKCVKRSSIPNISEEKLAELSAKEGSMTFSKISEMTPEDNEKMVIPPAGFVDGIAQGLRRAMGLNLFNFDMIKDLRFENHFLILDINYFPGYEKIPDYETVMVDFMWKIANEKKKLEEPVLIGIQNGKSCLPCCRVV